VLVVYAVGCAMATALTRVRKEQVDGDARVELSVMLAVVVELGKIAELELDLGSDSVEFGLRVELGESPFAWTGGPT
jgi:hypothetical protein